MRSIKIYDSCMFTTAPALEIDGNPDYKRVFLVHDDGSEECIFLGKEYVEEDNNNKARLQGYYEPDFIEKKFRNIIEDDIRFPFLDNLENALKVGIALCEKFINKVDTGRARSVETYADCKNFLEAAKKALGDE